MFLNDDQEKNFNELISQDKTNEKDVERKALFYIFAGNEDLYNKVNNFYDFEENSIRLEGFEEVDLTSSSRSLVELAFNLYNNYSHLDKEMKSVLDLFGDLDIENFELALQAIRVRFNRV